MIQGVIAIALIAFAAVLLGLFGASFVFSFDFQPFFDIIEMFTGINIKAVFLILLVAIIAAFLIKYIRECT